MNELATQTEELRSEEDGASVEAGVSVRMEVYTQTDTVVVDHTSSGVVAESKVELREVQKEACDAWEDVSALCGIIKRQKKLVFPILTNKCSLMILLRIIGR